MPRDIQSNEPTPPPTYIRADVYYFPQHGTGHIAIKLIRVNKEGHLVDKEGNPVNDEIEPRVFKYARVLGDEGIPERDDEGKILRQLVEVVNGKEVPRPDYKVKNGMVSDEKGNPIEDHANVMFCDFGGQFNLQKDSVDPGYWRVLKNKKEDLKFGQPVLISLPVIEGDFNAVRAKIEMSKYVPNQAMLRKEGYRQRKVYNILTRNSAHACEHIMYLANYLKEKPARVPGIRPYLAARKACRIAKMKDKEFVEAMIKSANSGTKPTPRQAIISVLNRRVQQLEHKRSALEDDRYKEEELYKIKKLMKDLQKSDTENLSDPEVKQMLQALETVGKTSAFYLQIAFELLPPEQNLKICIAQLKEKSEALRQQGEKVAATAALVLAENLVVNLIHLKKDSNVSQFKQDCNEDLENASKELNKHRGFKRILVTIAQAVTGLSLFHLVAIAIKKVVAGQIALFNKTESAALAEKAAKYVSAIVDEHDAKKAASEAKPPAPTVSSADEPMHAPVEQDWLDQRNLSNNADDIPGLQELSTQDTEEHDLIEDHLQSFKWNMQALYNALQAEDETQLEFLFEAVESFTFNPAYKDTIIEYLKDPNNQLQITLICKAARDYYFNELSDELMNRKSMYQPGSSALFSMPRDFQDKENAPPTLDPDTKPPAP